MGVDYPSTTAPWLECNSAQCLKIVILSWNMLNFAKLTGNGAVKTWNMLNFAGPAHARLDGPG